MESFRIENLSFAYPNEQNNTLSNINLTVKKGEFVTVCGKSGCGKTTLLRLLKRELAPFGQLEGTIYFEGKPVNSYDSRTLAQSVGFVMQDAEAQIVTDKVWHELAFGLESLGVSQGEIRTRVSEMASFFGIEHWFYKNVNELSGGQKQLVNLASVLVMQPSVVILDEPTSQLDPIAAGEFIATLSKINRELGTTVIMSEHRLEDALAVSDRAVVMDDGRIFADDTPKAVGAILDEASHYMLEAMPVPMRVHSAVPNSLECPVTVREGRMWLDEYSKIHSIQSDRVYHKQSKNTTASPFVELKDVWYRYTKDGNEVIKGINATVSKGEHFAIVGGNGAGKTTLLRLVSGMLDCNRGNIRINGEIVKKSKETVAMLPQNPCSLFVKDSVYRELEDGVLSDNKDANQIRASILRVSSLCHIHKLFERHPFDLSGGEQQRVALAKVLLTNPSVLLLDEPTKGMDAHFKREFAHIIQRLTDDGVTVVTVTHDIEFCALYADRCALMFDGDFTSMGTPGSFFAGNSFYTTSANRMARCHIPSAVTAEDIILACGGRIPPKIQPSYILPSEYDTTQSTDISDAPSKKSISLSRLLPGVIFALLFVITVLNTDRIVLFENKVLNSVVCQLISIGEITLSLMCLLPRKEYDIAVKHPKKAKASKKSVLVAVAILFTVPLTVYTGTRVFGTKNYYLISIVVIIQTLIPFFVMFEGRKPKAAELVLISSLCGFAVAGRGAFFMLPQFKPIVALVIVTGVCFGGQTGFVTGAVSAFVSNFFFGQGPWTPWQMLALGIVGGLSGVLFSGSMLPRTKGNLCFFGIASTLVLYGAIMNTASAVIMQPEFNIKVVAASLVAGLPMDIVHAASTGFFMWFASEPLIQKLERIKVKYGFVSG